MKTTTTFLFFLICFISQCQEIISIVGSGIPGYSGDNIDALSAQLTFPRGVTVDNTGAIYIADQSANRIRKVEANGLITTIAGVGVAGFNGDGILATNAKLNIPHSIAVDHVGNVYIADEGNHRIRKINTSGIISTIAGNGMPGFSGDNGLAVDCQLDTPTGVAVDQFGVVYIADRHNNRIRKIDSLGIISTIAGTGIAGYSGDGLISTVAQINDPTAICVGGGFLYFTDGGNNRIRKIHLFSSLISTLVGNGTLGTSGDEELAINAEITTPSGLAIDELGTVYFSGKDANHIRKISSDGIVHLVAGVGTEGYSGDFGDPLLAELNSPRGLCIDEDNNLLIADYGNHRIRKICSTSCSASIESFDQSVEVYPNPTNQFLHVKTIESLTKEYIILNSIGKVVYQGELSSSNSILDLNHLSNGIYFLKINDKQLKFSLEKL